MSKSIWDTRFSPQRGRGGVTFDSALKAASWAQDDDIEGGEWRTINGAHIHVNAEGEVDAGAEGKFNGSDYNEASAKAQEKKAEEQNKKEELTDEEIERGLNLTGSVYKTLHSKHIDHYSDIELKNEISNLTNDLKDIKQEHKKDGYKEGTYRNSINKVVEGHYENRIKDLKHALAAREYKYSRKDVKDISSASLRRELDRNEQKMKDKYNRNSDEWMYRALNNRNGDIRDELKARYKAGRLKTWF